MIKYKNISGKVLTFHGVTFNPNDIKEVPRYINHLKMIRVKETNVTAKPKAVITSPKEELPKAAEQKEQEQPTKRQYTRRNKTSNQ